MRPRIPIEIVIEITGKCRHACPYCTGPRTPHVPLKDIQATLEEAANLGVGTIRITGGEPLLHPDIKAILVYAKAKKFTVILNTSADNIDPDLMETIITNVSMAHVSLQGHDEKSNVSYTRSRTPFFDKIKNILLLRTHLPTLWIATVITPAMARSFAQFVPLVKKINPAAWLLQRPISELNEDLKQMGIPFYRALTLQIMKARRANINAFISNPIPMCIVGNLRIGKQAFLGAKLDEGHSRIVRSARGFFKPNYFIETNLGNTIQAAWEHPFLNELDRTDYLPDLCQLCPLLDTCRGGSRSMALRTHGTVLAPDPLFDRASAEKTLSGPTAGCSPAYGRAGSWLPRT